jgi:hypothetical protein
LLTSETSRDDVAEWQHEPVRDDSPVELAVGLQLLRASSITSMRLQLALARRDRKVAMAALDTLAAVDAEIEGLVDSLSGHGAAAPELAAISAWLAQEKKAASAERLNLACDLSGPGLVSRSGRLSEAADEDRGETVDQSSNEALSAVDAVGTVPARPAPARRWWPLVLLALTIAALVAGLIITFALPPGDRSPSIAELGRLIGLR